MTESFPKHLVSKHLVSKHPFPRRNRIRTGDGGGEPMEIHRLGVAPLLSGPVDAPSLTGSPSPDEGRTSIAVPMARRLAR